MRQLISVIAFFLSIWGGTALAQVPDPAPWDRLLQRYVLTGADGLNRVDYAAWAASPADRTALDGYIASLAAARPSQMARADAFAYWANLYNAATIKVVLGAYPVASIRDIPSRGVLINPLGGPWKMNVVTVEGRAMSLDDIEHGTMRPTFRDPRVHYSVNCASVGCPNLQREAFRGERLEAQLDAAARAYINSPRGVRVGPRGMTLSNIYQWFRADFGSEAELRAHLARYAQGPLAQQIRSSPIAGYAYDWALNETPRRTR
jgi:hypothetical protein